VDADWLTKPRQWTMGKIQRFIMFIGPISSIFDYMTFLIMLYVFDCWNNPAPVSHRLVRRVALHPDADHSCHPHQQDTVHPKPGQLPLIATSVIIVSAGAWLTVSPLAGTLGFVPLPRCIGCCWRSCCRAM